MSDQFKDDGGPLHPGLNCVINTTGRPEYMLLTDRQRRLMQELENDEDQEEEQ